VKENSVTFYFLGVGVTTEQTPPILPPLQIPVAPLADTTGTPLSTPASPALSDDSDCLFRLDVDNVRSLLPQDITALPPVLKVVNEGTVMFLTVLLNCIVTGSVVDLFAHSPPKFGPVSWAAVMKRFFNFTK